MVGYVEIEGSARYQHVIILIYDLFGFHHRRLQNRNIINMSKYVVCLCWHLGNEGFVCCLRKGEIMDEDKGRYCKCVKCVHCVNLL